MTAERLIDKIHKTDKLLDQLDDENERLERTVAIQGMRHQTTKAVYEAIEDDWIEKCKSILKNSLLSPNQSRLFEKMAEYIEDNEKRLRGNIDSSKFQAGIKKLMEETNTTMADLLAVWIALGKSDTVRDCFLEEIVEFFETFRSPELDHILLENLGEEYFTNGGENSFDSWLLYSAIYDFNFLKEKFKYFAEKLKEGEDDLFFARLTRIAENILTHHQDQLSLNDIEMLLETIDDLLPLPQIDPRDKEGLQAVQNRLKKIQKSRKEKN